MTDFSEPLGPNTREFIRKMDFSRLLLENMEAGVVACDENGKLVLFNRTAREWHGADPASIPQSEWPNYYGLFEADGATPMTADNIPLVRAFRGEAIKNLELVIAPKNLPARNVLCSGSRVLDGDGRVVGAAVIMNDITERKQMEAAARDNRDMIVRLTAQVPGVVYQYRLYPDGRSCFPFASEGMNTIYEVTPEEVREDATPVFGRLHPLDHDYVADAIRESARTLQPFHCEFRVILPRQGFRWRSSDAMPHRMRDGGTLWYGIITDITERKQAEDELQNLRTAVDQSANTIVITDPSGRIEYVNPAFEKSTGYTTTEALGQNPRVLKSGQQDAGFYRRLWETISAGEIWRGQFQNRRKDGTLYWESATISPVLNALGEIVHFIAIKENITDRKALEANLLEALDRAESANRAKSDFLAVMSHELRTPLNGVLGFAELLSETPLNEEQMDFAQTIKCSGNHLLDVVNDILDFSSIEKGRMVLEPGPVVIADLVESSTLAARKVAADKGLEFRLAVEPGTPAQVTGDGRRIRQVLINLLGNAVKFTMRGSVLLRVAGSASHGRGTLDFSIEDTGPGIPTEMLGYLFKPFTQADSTLRRQFEGTGLGLAISNRLATAMGGSISVVSAPGKGSTFTFHLPLEAAAPAFLNDGRGIQPARPDGGSQLPENPVLVVEDDPSNSMLAGKMLVSLGYRAEFASNGNEALAAFSPGKFAAILMDMRMPVMDGLEATRRIRKIEAGAGGRVPVIALTANVMPGDCERCLAAGMDDFLSKPFKRADLAFKLGGAIRAPRNNPESCLHWVPDRS